MKLPFVLAKKFVAGESFSEAKPEVEVLNKKQIKVTLDLLGENVSDKETADLTVQSYIDLIDEIHNAGLDSSISIKLTMLGLDIDREYCKENLFSLLEVAKRNKQFVRIDMEGSDYTDVTIQLFKEAFSEFGAHVGIVIQAYLHRTEKDINELANLGADIRLCKGAYKEPKNVAIQDMDEIRAKFKDYTKILFEKTNYPRIATHDDELINWVKSYTQDTGISKEKFEFQMLYGLRQETMEDFVRDGYNARVYVPYGTMWFPYYKRRLMERKENVWFILSTMFKN
ncbi:proline dehydrogenase family protein [Gracilimonas amylolytica]|uniref:proline dehydrogenase family protein n=1 Tax=Gracilimonas amylolytica TaxID=1749045 RepID=UPI000CD8305D|nr:proline dehydrogenase family protein [Gracilimonas amylolytica]